MTFEPSKTLDNTLKEQVELPPDVEERFQMIAETLEEHARMINRKDTGQYDKVELPVNQQFFGANPQTKHTITRKVIDFGTLPNNAIKNVAHGLTDFPSITFTRIYGTATHPPTVAIPIPYVDYIVPANSLQLYIDATNVAIGSAFDWTPYTKTFVILEFFRS